MTQTTTPVQMSEPAQTIEPAQAVDPQTIDPEQTADLTQQLIEEFGDALDEEEFADAAAGQTQGKALRKEVPRTVQGEWKAFDGRPDPVALLKEQGTIRVQNLLPERYLRMSASPFTFYRGAALIMASDLSRVPNTGITVQACGDAHISNFGFFGSPEHDLVFDINDFDETAPGPWEWDVKRLAASVYICAEDLGLPKKEADAAVRACAASYREAMAEFAQMGAMDIWYAHASTAMLESVLAQKNAKMDKKAGKVIDKARKKDSYRAVMKLTEEVGGRRRFRSEPPVLVPVRDLASYYTGTDCSDVSPEVIEKLVTVVLKEYRETLSPDKQHLLSQYKGVDMAHKVVGVGSVGTMAWVIMLQGGKEDDYLVLQIKEAQESVLERFVGSCGLENMGQRVVQGQRAMQTASDILLGWTRSAEIGGRTRDFYVRQLWNSKGSINLDTLNAKDLKTLSKLCGWTLAHAHARTGNRFLIAGYLGKSDVFDEAMVKFSAAYSKQNMEDYKRFMEAIAAGELPIAEAAE